MRLLRTTLLLLIMFVAPGLTVLAAPLPGLENVNIPEQAPQPAELLSFEPGSRHPHHYELLAFYRELARRSDRVRLEIIGRSAGGREQMLVYFGSPERLQNIEQIRADRVRASRAGEGPPVVWLGYSVHGNEASGASAAPLVAWYLAFGEDPRVRRWLEQLVIVMQPVINADGLDRFAHWVNMHRGRNPSADPNDREHNEAWPNGRTSYYWFDLNRDWMPLTHPVSRQRITHYRQWRPHVLTDAHEMGHRSSYFFQPGIPERNNPRTPEAVFEFTRRIGEYHGRILDAAGEPYYTRESFDDYYLGKGSTYPDLTGGVGILFEQGSARGHRMETPYGLRAFADGVANQVRTSISTLEASVDMADELIEYQAGFFAEARENAAGGWLLGDDGDPARARGLLAVLLGHGIEVHAVDNAVDIDGRRFQPGHAWMIPASQDLSRFIEAIFATPVELPMETFYDVSAWPLQHAWNLPLARVQRLPARGTALTEADLPNVDAAFPDSDAVAFAIDWRQHNAPPLLADLLAEGYRVQSLEEDSVLRGERAEVELIRGSLLIHTGIQPEHLPPVVERLRALTQVHPAAVTAIHSGLAVSGLDLGSPSAPVLEAPKPLLLAGDGVSSYASGQVWRWFDLMLDQPITRSAPGDLPSNLDEYSHVIVPEGRYDAELGNRLEAFVGNGGTVIALGRSARWVESLELGWSWRDDEEDENATDQDDAFTAKPYADFELDFARTLIGGSALAVELDPSHPLAWGYTRPDLTLFRQGAHVLAQSDNPYATPGRYATEPLVAGYLSDKVKEKLAATPAVSADRVGGGLVIRIADNPLFRGYWVGAEKLLANALFHSQLIDATRLPE